MMNLNWNSYPWHQRSTQVSQLWCIVCTLQCGHTLPPQPKLFFRSREPRQWSNVPILHIGRRANYRWSYIIWPCMCGAPFEGFHTLSPACQGLYHAGLYSLRSPWHMLLGLTASGCNWVYCSHMLTMDDWGPYNLWPGLNSASASL